MNATETIDSRIKAFKVSSSFTPGDPQSFSIKLSDRVGLPGKFDADEYVSRLGGGAAVADKNVLVICPGNGGLCVAALRAGASTVVAVEPRTIYDRALAAVSDFTSEVIGTTFNSRRADAKLFEKFDVIFWTEGLDEVQHPKSLFDAAISALAPRGRFFLEVPHGHHGVLPESTNSWRPTKVAFKETIDGYPTLDLVTQLSGRDQIRVIYELQSNETAATKPTAEGSEDSEDSEDVKYFRRNLFAALKVPKGYMDAETEEERAALLNADAPRHVHIDMAKGADKEFADKIKGEIDKNREDIASKIEPFVSKEFVQQEIEDTKRLDKARETTAAQRLAERIKSLIPTETPVTGELDSVYEGRSSTPKSKDKKTRSTRTSKKKKSDNSKS